VKENPNLMVDGRRKRRSPCLVANGRRRRSSFSPLFIFPPTNFTQTFIFSFDFKLLLYHGSRPLLTHFLPFPWPINYDRASQCHKSFPHSLPIWFWLKIYFLFFKIMASHMVTFYEPQVAKVNEKPTRESSLNLALMSHPSDEDPNPRKVRTHFEVNPLRTWYSRISPNFCTLVILL